MLDAVVDYLPAPTDLPPVKGHDMKTGAEIERQASDERAVLGARVQDRNRSLCRHAWHSSGTIPAS